MWFKGGLCIALVFFVSFASAQSEKRVSEDYHLTVYKGEQAVVTDIELFTKQADRSIFFGVTCTSMSPFPLVQILLFNDEVLSETPKFLSVSYRIDGEKMEHQPILQGILMVEDSVDEYSNKVRLELKTGEIRSMNVMDRGYRTLLNDLQAGQQVEFILQSRSFGTKAYQFSLMGLANLMAPYESVCR